jgi:hypothetical protein
MLVFEINGVDINEAYDEGIIKMRICGVKDDSMRGPVYSIPGPAMLTIEQPWQRVLFDPTRNANPFFHVMEFIWMMAGSDKVHWIAQFNKNIRASADTSGIIHGAYGLRWRSHFMIEQILQVVEILRKDPLSRRAVIGMWDPMIDLDAGHNDYPCNTHIYFRVMHGKLEMTVCNRSNDIIWGMLGANAVHMTMLQEVIASALGMAMGKYRAFTNNLHIYEKMPNFQAIWNFVPTGGYTPDCYPIQPILGDKALGFFQAECEHFIRGEFARINSPWLLETARPMHDAYLARKEGKTPIEILNIQSADWQKACTEWMSRKGISL